MTSEAWRWLRARMRLGTVLLAALWGLLLWKLAPHLGAVVGVRTEPPVAPAWSALALDGTALSAEGLRGKVVLVNFWATWCLPCRAEMPLLEQMWQRHRGADFVLVGLSVDRTGREGVMKYVADRGVTYPVAIVDAAVEAAFGGVRGIPTSILLDRDGRVVHRVVGPLGPASLELAVRRLKTER